jgi:hypothetical protein
LITSGTSFPAIAGDVQGSAGRQLIAGKHDLAVISGICWPIMQFNSYNIRIREFGN